MFFYFALLIISMNGDKPDELPGLNKTDLQKYYKAGSWARFLAVIGICTSCILLLIAVFGWAMMKNKHVPNADNSLMWQSQLSLLVLPALALIYFIPSVLLFRFSTRAMRAVRNSSQADISLSVSRLYLFFKYLGVLAIALLIIYTLLMIVTGIASIIGWGKY
jgi:predicted ferric reductase